MDSNSMPFKVPVKFGKVCVEAVIATCSRFSSMNECLYKEIIGSKNSCEILKEYLVTNDNRFIVDIFKRQKEVIKIVEFNACFDDNTVRLRVAVISNLDEDLLLGCDFLHDVKIMFNYSFNSLKWCSQNIMKVTNLNRLRADNPLTRNQNLSKVKNAKKESFQLKYFPPAHKPTTETETSKATTEMKAFKPTTGTKTSKFTIEKKTKPLTEIKASNPRTETKTSKPMTEMKDSELVTKRKTFKPMANMKAFKPTKNKKTCKSSNSTKPSSRKKLQENLSENEVVIHISTKIILDEDEDRYACFAIRWPESFSADDMDMMPAEEVESIRKLNYIIIIQILEVAIKEKIKNLRIVTNSQDGLNCLQAFAATKRMLPMDYLEPISGPELLLYKMICGMLLKLSSVKFEFIEDGKDSPKIMRDMLNDMCQMVNMENNFMRLADMLGRSSFGYSPFF